jgi:hypothetical protein
MKSERDIISENSISDDIKTDGKKLLLTLLMWCRVRSM